MSGNEGRNEDYKPKESNDNAGASQQKSGGFDFTDIMKDVPAQPKVGDLQAEKPTGADRVSDKEIQKMIADARQHLSPELKSSIEEAGKIHDTLNKSGKTHEEIQLAQQAQIDSYAKSLDPSTHLASAQNLQQYMNKMSKVLDILQS
jgi:hypothetical protein